MDIISTFFGLLLQGLINLVLILIAPIFQGLTMLIFGPGNWWNGDPAEIHQMVRIALEVIYPLVGMFDLRLPLLAMVTMFGVMIFRALVAAYRFVLELIPVAG